jgi:mono/diheme cytochrome c family protein
MHQRLPIFARLVGFALALPVVGSVACESPPATGNDQPDAGPEVTATTGTVERGQYLVDHVLACGVCHTPNGADGKPDMTKYLAGSRSYDFTDIDGTIVTVNAENLTNHNPEGLNTWSDEQIRRALTVGIDDENISIYPIMPYPEYALLSRADVDSVIQYLRTVAPNDNVVPADFPYFDQHPPAPAVDDASIPHATLDPASADYAASERGRYLAATACLYCHTPQLAEDVPDMTKAFAGGKQYTFIRGEPLETSVNITPDPDTGIGNLTVDDIVTIMKTDTDPSSGRTLCSTHPGGPEYFGGMTDDDIHDLAVYIHNLPPVNNGPFQCGE